MQKNYTHFKSVQEKQRLSLIYFLFHQQVLLNYPSLRTINLHGNSIEKLMEIDKLAGLPNLKTVSLHGNPIAGVIEYKNYILSTLPQIQNLDFTTITKADRETSYEWNKLFGERFKKKAKKYCKLVGL